MSQRGSVLFAWDLNDCQQLRHAVMSFVGIALQSGVVTNLSARSAGVLVRSLLWFVFKTEVRALIPLCSLIHLFSCSV